MRQAWYLGKVSEKKNREWTTSEKMAVFTLRIRNYSATEIASRYRASISQIYNVVRLVRKGLKNECYMCGNPLTEKELLTNKKHFIKACEKCKSKALKYKKEIRKEAEKAHLCVYCRIKPAIIGHKSCPDCISLTHRRRYVKGLCGQCGKKPIGKNKLALCEPCAKEIRIKASIYRKGHP
jgi:transposase